MRHFALAASITIALLMSTSASADVLPPTADSYRTIADQVEANLHQQILEKWFPAARHVRGGFRENFNRSWQSLEDAGDPPVRHIVYQSRLTWTAAAVMLHDPAHADLYRPMTDHGLAFLASRQWDQQHGGFFWAVDPAGKPIADDGQLKFTYGNAFGIYAAAENFRATHNPAALDLAKRAFTWLDQFAHDAQSKGYFELANETYPGAPHLAPTAKNLIGGTFGQKSMNTSIHVLEALTALYKIWPDPLVKQRLDEMFHLVRDRIYAEPGHLVMFFSQDWQPQPTEDSYGHDVETAYLLVEAADALGMPDDKQTWHVARSLVDHALKVAVNPAGGLYDSGGIDGGDHPNNRDWWTQAEWLNALLLMHERFGQQTPKYWNAFTAQWNWIQKYQIDPIYRGWFAHITNDNQPIIDDKSNSWTECYHQGRALMNVSERLRTLAQER